jgi:hypothetical protein
VHIGVNEIFSHSVGYLYCLYYILLSTLVRTQVHTIISSIDYALLRYKLSVIIVIGCDIPKVCDGRS